jgi:hypothetical protein
MTATDLTAKQDDPPYVPESYVCQYCDRKILEASVSRDFRPPADDKASWGKIARYHAHLCDWVWHRGFQIKRHR